MSVYKRGDIWWVRFTTPGGQCICRSAKTTRRKQAVEFEHRLKTLCRWLHRYLFGVYLNKINRDLIDRITRARLKDGVSKATVNRLLELIRAILRCCFREWEWLEKVPYIRLFPERNRRVRWLTEVEVEQLLAVLPENTAEMMRFTLATGLRESNVTRMEWSQVDMDRRCAWIHADQAKAGKLIGVPLNEDALAVLQRQIGKHAQFVFTYRGKPILRANTRAWRNALRGLNITDFRWHDLRHSWPSWHIQNGTPAYVLQELGGCASMQMVQRYAHLSAEHLLRYADNLADKGKG